MAGMSKPTVRLPALLAAAATLWGALNFVGVAPQPSRQDGQKLRGSLRRYAGQEPLSEALEPMVAVEPEVTAGQMLRAVVSIVAALLVTFMPMAEAEAARSGGRIGGSFSRMRRAPPRARGPRRAAPTRERVIERNNTTVITPGYGRFGGPPVMFGRPSLGDVVAGAAVQGAVNGAVSGAIHNSFAGPRYDGPTPSDRMLENQIQQDERALDQQAKELADLKQQIAELQQKKN
mmetsp:Transcript_36862/g.85008  ORF Transcript_36862/g.85008 Transcript_36862/m.85008 type:complete len:233 (-) Transcript_36862:179-877(-)